MVRRLRESYISESALFVIKKDGRYVKDMTDGSEFTKSYQQAEKYTNKKSAQEAARDYARRYGKGYSVFNVFGNNKTGATNESKNRRTFGKKHLRNMSNCESLKRKRSKHMNERYTSCLYEGPTKAYPGDIGPSNTTLDTLFKNLTPNARDMEFLKDNYGIDTFDVKWHNSDKNAIDIFATMMSEDGQYRADETFYVYESKKYYDSYVLGTEELGVRIIDKISEVWDLVSVCLRKQLK